ncbi:MAG: tRNA uridine-5-carboxymethylaminomethyl(34) synthesis GTPase MnmE [Lachnospiraceae bacterium]|nr:tRNA uridine-5-carboxymethylaminomethyl(34) synthesis GTPase MnmE [Lachnospiraceae bacterium]
MIDKSLDTIAAIATAMTDSGIGIIRVSGEDAISIVSNIFQNKYGKHVLTDYKTHTIHYGFIYDETELLDEVMISIMKSPNSYTMEDTVEINCHGGVLLMNRVLEAVLKHGARLAEAGEFTKRAFLNGRIDLSKAEAVMDLIQAKNDFALKSSVSQLHGAVSNTIRDLREKIIYEIAFIESALDDPEHISIEGYSENLAVIVESLSERLQKLMNSFQNGKILKEGISTVIVGKPNAGKSSLLNILVGEEKAIVTNIAGTTRDVLEETIRLHGISLNVIDTAGIRDTDDVVEKIGVDKAKNYAANADLIIYVVDSSTPLDENDENIMKMIRDKNCIVLLNKSDLENIVTEEELTSMLKQFTVDHYKMIRISAKDHSGIEEFEDTIKDMFFHGELQFNDQVYITNERHMEAIRSAYNSLQMVKRSLEDQMPEDFYSIDLMSAYASLGSILGEEVGEDLVKEIFSKFCMGK